MRWWIVLGLLLIFFVCGGPPAQAQEPTPSPTLGPPPATPTATPLPPPPLVELNEVNLRQAAVFLRQVYEGPNGPVITCVGSGTLVSADGLILTNAHTVMPSDNCRADRIVVAMTLRADEAPVPTYVAEVLDANAGLDLAMLRITRYIDGRIVERNRLQLPFVELGDSTQVRLDDTVLFVGYPGIGNEPVQTLPGTISGFTAEARVGDRAWLRTRTAVPGGMSGGAVYDRQGRLIGIPTIAPARGAGGEALNCRSIQDSNGDGQVNEEDRCIPVGGFISAIRPVQLARGLVRAAALGITLAEDYAPAVFAPPAEAPDFRRVFVSTGVNAAGMPINVVQRAPAGTNSLYLFFDYINMQNGMVYELQTTVDGRPNPLFSLPPVTWNGGPRGMWYLGSSGVPFPNGTYEFTLFVQGRQVANYQLTIGGAPGNLPSFSDISFGLENPQGEVVGTNFILPETNIVRARFNYRNMTPGQEWMQVWYLDGRQISERVLQAWEEEGQGVSTGAAIVAEGGLLSGRYRLELYIGEQLAATSDFVIAGGAEANQSLIFSNFMFAGGEVAGVPQPPITDNFNSGLQQLYLFFDWRQLSPTTPWTWRWRVDGEVLFEVHTQWAAQPSGDSYFIALGGSPALPDGTYSFEIEMGGIVIVREEAEIGLGQLPLDVFASAEGVQLVGRVIDAESKQGIPGAMFIMLLPEFSVEDFLWDESQVLSTALADAEGYFRLPALLPRGTEASPVLYSLLVRAEGYFPMAADGIAVTDATESPMELIIELNRD